MKNIDLSKFANKVKEPSSSDDAMLFMAKTLIPTLPKKIKLIIGVALYLILSGLILNLYSIYKLITLF